PARGRQVLEVGAPAAADVEHRAALLHVRGLGQPAELLDLRLLEVVGALEERAGVVHALVEPQAEELVRDVVGDFDFGLGRAHLSSSAGRRCAASPASRTRGGSRASRGSARSGAPGTADRPPAPWCARPPWRGSWPGTARGSCAAAACPRWSWAARRARGGP